MTESSPNLRALFLSTLSKEAALHHLGNSGNDYQENVEATIASFKECRRLLEQLAIFSPNETHDDISTSAIQFLGIDYRLAELLLKSYDSNRQLLLKQALDLLVTFLMRLDTYEILSQQNKQLLDQYQENPHHFQLASMSDAAERRRIKVARFQKEKGLRSKLELLRSKSEQNALDEDAVRDLYFTELELFAEQAFQSLDMIAQENNILSQAQSNLHSTSEIVLDPRQINRDIPHGYSERLDGPMSGASRSGPLLSKEGKPLQPFTITGKRSQLRQGVFRPGHNLPTMSIEDYLEEEKRRGGIVDGGGKESRRPPRESDEDDMELADQETMKARAWDEYTEANPKGSGNTMNRG